MQRGKNESVCIHFSLLNYVYRIWFGKYASFMHILCWIN